jgi:UPF0755 protein
MMKAIDLGRSRRAGSLSRFVLLVAAVLLGIVAGAGVLAYRDYRHYLDSPEPALTEPHLLEIERGMSFHAITRLLERERVISRPRWVELEARRLEVTTKMKAGEYIFHPGLTPLQVLDMIIRGDITRVTLTVPEGFTIYDVAKRLSTLGPWTEEGFIAAATDPAAAARYGVPIASFEGYLFPAVYNLKMSMDEKTVVELMVLRALQEKNPDRLARAQELGLSWHQALTLASLLQKEAMVEGEMPIIAGVFVNRLQRNIPLQSDPTAIYGVKDIGDGITRADLRRPSPYNTYLNSGLPPGPICNPGAAAIKAALHPVKTDYIFFVADGHGRHNFSRTYAEHERNVSIYRSSLAARSGQGALDADVLMLDPDDLKALLAPFLVPQEPPAAVAPAPAPAAAPAAAPAPAPSGTPPSPLQQLEESEPTPPAAGGAAP